MASRPVRRDPTRADLARRGLVAVLVVVAVAALLTARAQGKIGGPAHVTAHLANAGGSLVPGSDVKMRGVIVGSVDSLSRAPHGGVDVTLEMNDGELDHIPTNAVARILPATVFGTSFVDLATHGARSPEHLRAGAVVPADRSQHTLELQQALDDVDHLVKALRPAQLSATLSAAAHALEGRGATLGSIIDGLDAYLGKVEPELPLIRSDLAALADNLQLVRRVAPDLLDATRDSLGTLKTIAQRRAQVAALLQHGDRLARSSNRFLRRNRQALVSFLNHAAIVADVYYDLRHAAFTESFAGLRMVNRKLGTIIHHGWADNTVIIQTTPNPYYTRADCPRFGRAHGDNCGGGR